MFQKMKQCTKCKVEKLFSEFYKHKNHKFGIMSTCKECTKKIQCIYNNSKKGKQISYQYRHSLKGKISRTKYVKSEKYKFNRWKYWIKSEYNLTPKQYDKMFEKQNRVCAICKKLETAHNQYGLMRLAIDHNHKTGKIRGLLCQKCNQGIGLLGHNTKQLKQAINYLEGHYKV